MPGRYQFSLPERPSRDGWFRVGSLDITTTALLVGLGIASMFWYAVDKVSLYRLPYLGAAVRDGDYWRIVTWPIANPPREIWVVLTLAFFWFVGHRIEDLTGRRRFAWLIVAMAVFPAGIVTVLGLDPVLYTYGLGVLGIALLVVFALEHPTAMFFFGIPAWVIAAIYVGIDTLRYMGDRAYEPLVMELLVIVVGIVGARQCGLVENLTFIPAIGGKRRGTGSTPAKRRKGSGPSVVAGPWGGSAHTSLDQTELDLLLDKISANGMDSLSKGEKARLNELSKKLRGH